MAAVESSSTIFANPSDFVQIFGTPIHPEFTNGVQKKPYAFTSHWAIKIGEEYWMQYDLLQVGSQDEMQDRTNSLGADKELTTKLEGAKFLVGPSFNYDRHEQGMVKRTTQGIEYTVWINRLPYFRPANVERVQTIFVN